MFCDQEELKECECAGDAGKEKVYIDKFLWEPMQVAA